MKLTEKSFQIEAHSTNLSLKPLISGKSNEITQSAKTPRIPTLTRAVFLPQLMILFCGRVAKYI